MRVRIELDIVEGIDKLTIGDAKQLIDAWVFAQTDTILEAEDPNTGVRLGEFAFSGEGFTVEVLES